MKLVYNRRFWYIGLLLLCLGWQQSIAQPDRVRRKGRRQNLENTPGPTISTPKPTTTGKGLNVSGTLRDKITGEPIIGAYVRVKDQLIGAISNETGYFEFSVPEAKAVLQISYVGYATVEMEVGPDNLPLSLELAEDVLLLDEVVVSASRAPEKLLESPVTIERINIEAVRNNPALNMYDGLAALKGVDQFTPSLTFRVVNTRGYNTRTNTRVVFMQDGIDMQAPGLNFPIGGLNGSNDLDIESVELIPGASSALYGPNALNGMLITRTKNPFVYQGLAASARVGYNHFSSDAYNRPQPLFGGEVRYAKALGRHVAFKVNANFFSATDWAANSLRDVANYAGTNNLALQDSLDALGERNPGYDGLNVYGDEIALTFNDSVTTDLFGLPLLGGDTLRIARDGYRELEVGNTNARVLNGSAALHFRLGSDYELVASSRIGTGNTVYQAVNRYQILDFLYHQHRLELNGKHLMARVYASVEDAGNTYDTRFTGVGVVRAAKRDEAWFGQYLFAYNPLTNTFLNSWLAAEGLDSVPANNHAAARAFANRNNGFLYPYLLPLIGALQPGLDSLEQVQFAQAVAFGQARFEPGSPEFERALDSINNVSLQEGGAKFVDRTWFYHAEVQYDFSHLLGNAFDLQAGASFRQFLPNSEGTIFVDTADNRFSVWEYGGFVQARKRLADGRLIFTASARMDQRQELKPVVSPRLSAVGIVGPKRNHFIRASFQSAFRNPTLQAQYIDYDAEVFRYTGAVESIDRYYGLIGEDGSDNVYTENSLNEFLETGDSTRLQRYNVAPIKPEVVRSVEVGYRAVLFRRLTLDAVYYYTQFRNFHQIDLLVGPSRTSPGEQGSFLTVNDIRNGDYSLYNRYASRNDVVEAHGANLGLDLLLTRNLSFTGNVSYAAELGNVALSTASFNTPEWKFNVGFTGRRIARHLGFLLNFRWQDAFLYSDEEAFAEQIASFHTLDAQVSWSIPKIKTILKLGGTNVLNQQFVELFAGPTLGALYYFQVSFDQFLN